MSVKLGESRCQCAGCDRYFTGTSTFDKHRAWGDGGGTVFVGKNRPADFDRRLCLEPTSVGLVQRGNGVWGGPMLTDEQKAERGWS